MRKYSQINPQPQHNFSVLRATETRLNSEFPPLQLESRTHVDTACAAYHLGRKAQTLRAWASTDQGPIRPVRVNGRLLWPVTEIRAILEL